MEENSNNKNNSNIALFIFLALMVGLGFWIYSLVNYNSELEKVNMEKDILLESGRLRDSLLTESTKDYAKVITKYVNECGFTMNNKPISSHQIVEMLNELNSQNQVLKDSIILLLGYQNISKKGYSTLNDSLYIYKNKLNIINQWYGISIKMHKDTASNYIFTRQNSIADSALVIFPHVRNYLSKDTLGNWVIKIPQIIRTITTSDNSKKRRK